MKNEIKREKLNAKTVFSLARILPQIHFQARFQIFPRPCDRYATHLQASSEMLVEFPSWIPVKD